MAGCSQEDMTTELVAGDEAVKKEGITMTVKDFETDDATRTALTLNEETGLTFKWAESDLVGVFGSRDDQQVKLTISDGADTNEATFTSNDFQLSSSSTYRAYYPMTDANTASSSAITLDYTEQTQTDNASTAHLGAYDFLVSDKVTPTATNTAEFKFSHLGAAVRLQITLKNVPDMGDVTQNSYVPWSSVTLSTSDDSKAFITKGTLDLFGSNEFTATETASSVTLKLSKIQSAIGTENDAVDVWLMLAPTDLSGKTINVSMSGGFLEEIMSNLLYTSYQVNNNGTFSIDGKNFKAGCAYSLSVEINDWSVSTEQVWKE